MPEFTSEQQSAIEYRRLDTCVVAGPGSGKTTVLVERFKRLIEREGMTAQQILAITFTEKAAANMKSRLAAEFKGNPVRLRELERGWVSTIHGFCNRLLRENAIAAGLDPRFKMLDEREAEDLRVSCMNMALDAIVAERPEEALALIANIQAPMFLAGQLRSVYDAILAAGRTIEEVRGVPSPQGATPDAVGMADYLFSIVNPWGMAELSTPVRREHKAELLEWLQQFRQAATADFANLMAVSRACPLNLGRVHKDTKPALQVFRDLMEEFEAAAVDRHTAGWRALVFDVLSHFDKLYSQRKTEMGALDFNDLERRTIGMLLANEDVKKRVREQFRQIMLDEYQDINEQQAVLVSLIRGADKFFAVGDPNQSIYGFRHARPEIFRAYRDEVAVAGKHAAEILHNFRSRAPILLTVEAVLNGANGIDERELIATRQFHVKAEPSVEVLRVYSTDKDDASEREARWIAHRISELRGALELTCREGTRPAEFRDIAILCRVGDAMQPILDALDDAGIPYVCGRRQSFLSQREGLDIRAALHAIANPRDEISLATMLRSQLVGLSDEALLRLKLQGHSVVSGLNLVARERARLQEYGADDAPKLGAFIDNLKRWRAGQGIVPLDVLISRVLMESGFRWTPGTISGDNVEEFLRLARTRGAGIPLLDFLVELESVEGAASKEAELSDEDQGNRVQVMTTHAAKGLEFPITIIAAMEKEGRKGAPSVSFTPEFGMGLRWTDVKDNDGLKDTWAKANGDRLKAREDDENDRLLYVAMTRAEEHLILSYSVTGKSAGFWAKKVDEFFQLKGLPPREQAFIARTATVDATVRIVDTDPPLITRDRLVREPQVTVVERPELSDQHDTTVNVTSLTTFAICPRRYYLQRYVGWSSGRPMRFDPEDLPAAEEESGDTSAAELGTMVHEILAGKAGNWPARAVQLASVFTTSPLGLRVRHASKVEREWDFIAEVAGTLVRG
ncbi:MAG: helicase/exodeoxyribonuclease subunit, partial [Bryobacterales bacterium]|nr:helicase/exodeoxyribonuclease subunit [Bryobacterales bacterium]